MASINRVIITLAVFITSGRRIIPDLLDRHILKNVVYTNLNRYDAGWYEQIAGSGYLTDKSSAFFPLYPALIRGLSELTGLSYKACGQAISILCFVMALWLVQSLVERNGILRGIPDNKRAGRWIACLIAFNPVSFYYTICYTESLFLMLTLLFMISVADKRWLAAGIAGFFAGIARNSGVFLSIIFFFEYFRFMLPEYEGRSAFGAFRHYAGGFLRLIRDFRLRCLHRYRSFLCIFLIPSGATLYFVYLLFRFGSLTSALSAVDRFGRSPMAPWLTLFRGFQHNLFKIILTSDAYIFHYYLLELLAVFFFLFSAIFLLGRMPLSYNIFMMASLVLPLCRPAYAGWTDYFVSFPRYAATLFPYFAAQYLVVKNSRKAFIFYLAVCIYFLVRLVSFWSVGMFIS